MSNLTKDRRRLLRLVMTVLFAVALVVIVAACGHGNGY